MSISDLNIRGYIYKDQFVEIDDQYSNIKFITIEPIKNDEEIKGFIPVFVKH